VLLVPSVMAALGIEGLLAAVGDRLRRLSREVVAVDRPANGGSDQTDSTG
jgi:uncharacterized membrane protein